MRYVLALLVSLLGGPAMAVLPHEMLADPALEARARDGIGGFARLVGEIG